MKLTPKTLLLISLASASIAASAAPVGTPSSADENTSLASEFPGIRSYSDEHQGDAANQTAMRYPGGGEVSFVTVFPKVQSYADTHRNDAAAAANTSAFPSSADETTSLAQQGLAPGFGAEGASAYAGSTAHGASGE